MFNELRENFEILNEHIIFPNIQDFYITKKDIRAVLDYLKNSPQTMFSRLECIVAKDNTNNYSLTYILNSEKYNTKCAVSYCIDYNDSTTESIYDIYKSANWEEREIFDLFGITFKNHPNLKRILLPNSFKGHPLRKNYTPEDKRLAWNND